MVTLLIFALVVATGIALYKHLTLAEISVELQKFEATVAPDAKAIIAAIKAKL
jgi:hypothetical protein